MRKIVRRRLGVQSHQRSSQFLRFPLKIPIFVNIVLLLLVLSSSLLAHGQAVSATVVGRVTDTSQGAVVGAKVSLNDKTTGVHRSVVTSSDGEYQIPLVVPGSYTLTVESSGMKTQVVNGLLVEVNSTTRRDVALGIGQASETVEVSATAPALQTDRADITANFNARQVEDLPLSGNMNFQTAQNLVPGVTRAVFLNQVFTNAQSTLSNYVNGQTKLANNLQIEGIADNARTGELQLYIPPAEAIQTVDVNTSNYAPEFGTSSGYVTNVIIKSGTDKFHGSLFEFNRITPLTALNYFNTTSPKTPIVYNYYGGTVSGPVWKNKTYFFADFVRTDDHEGLFGVYTVPTAAYRAGNLSASSTAIYDPATGNTATGAGRTQFSYNGQKNVIDPARISSVAKNILNLLPPPNTGVPGALTNNYQSTTANNKDYYNYDIKLDQNLFAADRLSYRFSDAHIATYVQPTFGIAGGPASSGSEGNGIATLYTTAANYIHPFSGKLLTEARAGVTHYRNAVSLSDGGTPLSSQVGINGVNLSPATSGLSTIDITGYNANLLGYNKNFPTVRGETHIDIVNDWTWILGKHSIKFGFEFQRVRDDLAASGSYPARGIFSFRDGQTSISGAATSQANDFASFLLDAPSQVGRTIAVTEATWRQSYYIGFVQDTFNISPKLTATYGVRYDLYPPPTPHRNGGYSQYNPSNYTLSVGGIAAGLGNNLNVATKYANFAPRIGIAYRPDDSTVVRAGFGQSYYPVIGDSYAYYNYPYTQDTSFVGTSSLLPAVQSNGSLISMGTGLPALVVNPVPANGIITLNQSQTGTATYVVNTNQKIPYVEFWNATVERRLPGDFNLSIGYVGNIGVHALAGYNLNAATVPGTGVAGQPEYTTAFKRTGTTTLVDGYTTTHYDSLQVRLDRHFRNGLGITSSYTWGKALGYKSDTTSLSALPQYINMRQNYGRVTYDRAHTLVQSAIYELPFGHGKPWLSDGVLAHVAGGWQITGIVTEMSGLPLVLTASSTSLNAPGNTQFVNVVGPFQTPKGIGTGAQWFNKSAFSQPTTAVLGTGRQTMFAGPGFFNLDAAVFRRFAIRDRFSLELRAEAFGLTNTPQFANPDGLISDATFGQVTATQGATGSRVTQFSGKLSF
nr:carboxypeptidase regulatory-like domain-containing protein [Granulicella sp. L60]